MMRVRRRMAIGVGVAALVAGAMPSASASDSPDSGGATGGWQRVHEGWKSYEQGAATLPAARYCGTFDVQTTPVSQDIRSKVLTRWANGKPRDTYYTGPLTTKVTNADNGKSLSVDMGGDSWETDYSSGYMKTYRMFGPIGFGMPKGASRPLPAGFYVLDGYHVARFNADDSRRTLTVSLGTARDLCAELR